MSAQAVLSIMAPARPATPKGSPDAAPSGFEDLLAAAVSEDEAAAPSAAPRPAKAAEEPAADGDESVAGADGVATAEGLAPVSLTPPPVIPKAAEGAAPDGSGPQVLPGVAESKVPLPIILPGPGEGKGRKAQVQPDGATAKGGEPQVLPGAETAKGPAPQVLPGVVAAKQPEPQVLPDAAIAAVLAPRPSGDGDGIEAPPPEDVASAPRAGKQAAPVQAPLPQLRPLAERTSKPLDEAAKTTETARPADARTAAPEAPSIAAPTDKPVKDAAPVAAQGPLLDPAAAPAEAVQAGDPATPPTETAAPVRDHALSTLSRATIDATAQIAAQILRKLEGRSTRFEIALRPDELGRVDVKLDIDSEGRLAARLAFDNPAAATDLRGRADELRRQLEAAGFQLADDAFEFAERDSGSNAFDRGQDARHGQNRAFAAAARLNADIDVAQPPRWLALSLSPAGVDMKV